MSRILMVDDDADMMRISANWLKKAGHEVLMAASGEEALKTASEGGVDLIILDYAMPGMDGPTTLEALRSEDKTRDIPVIFRTGMDDEDSMQIMERLNPQGVAPKSEGKSCLMKTVEAALSV